AYCCTRAPSRLSGLGVIPTVGIEAAIAELEHCLARGMQGVILSRFPSGNLEPSAAEDDRFWARLVEADIPAHVHITSFSREAEAPRAPGSSGLAFAGATKAGAFVFRVVGEFIFSGMFDR